MIGTARKKSFFNGRKRSRVAGPFVRFISVQILSKVFDGGTFVWVLKSEKLPFGSRRLFNMSFNCQLGVSEMTKADFLFDIIPYNLWILYFTPFHKETRKVRLH
jgi:hypothetical protein